MLALLTLIFKAFYILYFINCMETFLFLMCPSDYFDSTFFYHIADLCHPWTFMLFHPGRRQTPTWMALIFSLTSLSIFSRIPLSSMGSVGLASLHPLQVIIAARQVSSG